MKLDVSIDGIKFGTSIGDIEVPPAMRVKRASGFQAWDDAFGGKGLTPSMVTLLTGVSGGGKSTMAQQVASHYAARGFVVVYNSGEESVYQVKMVYDRLNLRTPFHFGGVSCVDDLLEQCDWLRGQHKDKPFLLIQDSLQTLDDGKFGTGRITTKTAERALQKLTNWTKRPLQDVPDDVAFANTVVIGQVNKSGKMAGTNKLKHMVDAHLHLSIETDDKSSWFNHRILFTDKNRFGGAGATAFLRMTERGLQYCAAVSDAI